MNDNLVMGYKDGKSYASLGSYDVQPGELQVRIYGSDYAAGFLQGRDTEAARRRKEIEASAKLILQDAASGNLHQVEAKYYGRGRRRW